MDENEIVNTGGSFMNEVIYLKDGELNEIINMVQYVALSIFPLIMSIKLVDTYAPLPDERKNIIELFMEILIQIVITFLFNFFINKLLIQIPTYTKVNYHYTSIISANLIIPTTFLLSNNDILKEKLKILCSKICDLWNGSSAAPTQKSPKSTERRVNFNEALNQIKLYQPPVSERPMDNLNVGGSPSMAGTTSIDSIGNSVDSGGYPGFNLTGPSPQQSNGMDTNTIMPANMSMGGGFGTPF